MDYIDREMLLETITYVAIATFVLGAFAVGITYIIEVLL